MIDHFIVVGPRPCIYLFIYVILHLLSLTSACCWRRPFHSGLRRHSDC